MDKQSQPNNSKLFSWFDDPQQLQPNQLFINAQNPSYPNIDTLQTGFIQTQVISEINQMEEDTKNSPHATSDQIFTCFQQQQFENQQKHLKRQLDDPHNSRLSKDMKDEKQHLYSKAYRQRKKQRYKTLEDENTYLKKRINQLQYQLRQQQIELNRFKFPPPQKQLTLDQLRRQFLQRTVLVINQHKLNPIEQTKIVYTPKDPFYHEFLDIYAQRGFAGSRKIKLLDYHFNQILQTMLKDSERYFALMINKSQSWQDLKPLEEYESLNAAFFDVFQLNPDRKNRLKYFVKNLYPLHLQLNKQCSVFYKSYQNILKISQKIHNFMNQTYLTNMDLGRKRIELQTWFQFNKYGKLLRKLRFQWFDLLKKGSDQDEQLQRRKHSKGSKKKKAYKQEG